MFVIMDICHHIFITYSGDGMICMTMFDLQTYDNHFMTAMLKSY